MDDVITMMDDVMCSIYLCMSVMTSDWPEELV